MGIINPGGLTNGMKHFLMKVNISDPSFLKAFLLTLPGSVYWKDNKGVYRGCNSSMAAFAGLDSPDEIVGKTDIDLSWRDQEPILRAHDQAVITTNTEITTEESRKLANGHTVSCLTARKPLEDEKGQVVGILGICLETSPVNQNDEVAMKKRAEFHKKVSELWNENANIWYEASEKGFDVWRDCLNTPAFLNMLPDITNSTGLDIGCGDGHNSRLVARLCKSLVAIDVADKFIQINLNNPVPSNLIFKKINATNLPFPNEYFDFVIATMSFMDMPDFEKVLSEVHRVLAPSGFLQFSLIHPAFNEHLGRWVKDEEGEVLGFLMKDYFKESMGEIHEWQHLHSPSSMKKFKVPRFSKPLSKWLNALVRSGFLLDEVCEPYADDQLIKAHPELDTTRIVAHSLIIRVKKNESYKEPFRKIIEKLPGNIWWKDKNLKYLGCNDRVIEVLDLASRKEFIGKDDHQLWNKEIADKLLEADLYVLKTGETINLEETIVQGDGSSAIMLTNKSPLYDDDRNIIGIVGTSTDITYRKELEKNLRDQREKALAASKSKSEFIANMSHDLRTPITGMLGMVQDMLNTADHARSSLQTEQQSKATPTSSPYSPLLTNIIEMVRRNGAFLMAATDELLQLCNEILEVVSLESGVTTESPESFNLRELVEHNIELLLPVAQHKKLNLLHEINQSIPEYLYGLRIYLDRILLNLLSNALKFTESGFVKIKVQLSKADTIDHQAGNKVILQILVEDSGVGIPSDKFDTIFEHFSRLTPAYEGLYKGAGLGLYTVKRYLEAMGGKIDVKSEVGKGTCFTVTVPLMTSDHTDRAKESIRVSKIPKPISTAAIAAEFEKSPTPTEATASILIVEDNTLAAIAVRLALKPFNCATDVAKNGAQAVKKAQSESYDLILMDIGLPDFSGVEAVKRIRALADTQKSQVPIVALTGHAGDPEKQQECLNAGMQDVLSKPVQPLALESILQKYIFKIPVEKQLPQKNESLTDSQEPLAVIDWDACVRMCNGDPDFTRQLLAMLSADLKGTKEKLEKFYAGNNTQALNTELHRLRGGVCYLKLPHLENALHLFLQAVKAYPQIPEQLEKTYTNLQKAMDIFLEVWESKTF